MKRTRLRKKSNSSFKKLEDELWEECRRVTYEHYPNNCYTCSQKNLVGRNAHTGHMWPKGSLGASLKYDIRILRPQCYRCNMNLGGMGAVFYSRMKREEGELYMQQLEKDKIEDKKGRLKASNYYPLLLEEYKKIRK